MKSFERTLWEAADKLRKNLDAGEIFYLLKMFFCLIIGTVCGI